MISPNSPLCSYHKEKALGQLLLSLIESNQLSLNSEERGKEEVQIMTTFQRADQETPLRLALLMTNQRLLLLNINNLAMPLLLFSVSSIGD